jgi:hypothetical protein
MSATISELQALGAFAGQPEKRDVTFHVNGEPKTLTFYIRKAAYDTVSVQWRPENQGKDAIALRLASYVCDEKGAPVFTVEDITGTAERGPLIETLTIALFAAVGEVNGIKDDSEEKKESTSSGTNSSAEESAEEQ